MDTETKKKPLYVIAGPTAVGKSALGVELALKVGGEVISADSMQVYRGMDIGTAKIKPEEMKGVKHHLIDILDPKESFHVYDFKQRARECAEEIWSRGAVPIVVGGTGFYIQALAYDIDFSGEGADNGIRQRLEKLAAENGNEELFKILKELDPEAAAGLHPNNVRHVLRAVEFAMQNDAKISEHNNEQRQKQSPYNLHYFVLNDDRALIYERINDRVDKMMDEGLLDEVKALIDYGCSAEMTSMQGIGYKQLLAYFNKEYDLDEAVRLIKRDSRHFAKRQLTWFNREKDLHWIDRRELPDTRMQLDFIASAVQADSDRDS